MRSLAVRLCALALLVGCDAGPRPEPTGPAGETVSKQEFDALEGRFQRLLKEHHARPEADQLKQAKIDLERADAESSRLRAQVDQLTKQVESLTAQLAEAGPKPPAEPGEWPEQGAEIPVEPEVRYESDDITYEVKGVFCAWGAPDISYRPIRCKFTTVGGDVNDEFLIRFQYLDGNGLALDDRGVTGYALARRTIEHTDVVNVPNDIVPEVRSIRIIAEF